MPRIAGRPMVRSMRWRAVWSASHGRNSRCNLPRPSGTMWCSTTACVPISTVHEDISRWRTCSARPICVMSITISLTTTPTPTTFATTCSRRTISCVRVTASATTMSCAAAPCYLMWALSITPRAGRFSQHLRRGVSRWCVMVISRRSCILALARWVALQESLLTPTHSSSRLAMLSRQAITSAWLLWCHGVRPRRMIYSSIRNITTVWSMT